MLLKKKQNQKKTVTNSSNRLACLYVFFLVEVPGELDLLSFQKCVGMHVNRTKFERNSSVEYYHMTFIGKTKHAS